MHSRGRKTDIAASGQAATSGGIGDNAVETSELGRIDNEATGRA